MPYTADPDAFDCPETNLLPNKLDSTTSSKSRKGVLLSRKLNKPNQTEVSSNKIKI